MAFSRPTLKDLSNRMEADVASRLPGTDPKLRYSLLGILARVFAGAVHGLYGYLQWISKQVLPDTAEKEYLDRWSVIWNVLRKPAVSATGIVVCTGTNGSVIPAGTLLQRSDAVEFTTDADATIVAGTVNASVTAVAGGVAGNTAAASNLNFVTPVAGVNSTAAVDGAGLIGGLDIESDDDLRARLLARIQQPAQGGAAHDYIAWALEMAGVTRAWCYPLENGAGTVVVRFMMDDSYANGIPLAGDVTAVQNYIDARRPVAIAINGFTAVAPVAVPINFTLTVSPNTQAVKDAVTAELKDLILRDSAPGGTIRISRIREAISLAADETDHVLTAPAANVTHTTNQIATMGTVTFS
jgi:uncharacterized phage protein gp47/JayE